MLSTSTKKTNADDRHMRWRPVGQEMDKKWATRNGDRQEITSRSTQTTKGTNHTKNIMHATFVCPPFVPRRLRGRLKRRVAEDAESSTHIFSAVSASLRFKLFKSRHCYEF